MSPSRQWAVISVPTLVPPTGGQSPDATWSSSNLTAFANVAHWLPDVGVFVRYPLQAGLITALPRRVGKNFHSDASLPSR